MNEPGTSRSSVPKVAQNVLGNQMGLNGGIYQLKIFLLFLCRGMLRKYSFELGTEIKEAKKFDDIVFQYSTDGQKIYRLLQIKHKMDDLKKITKDDLLTEDAGDYSLIKYFFSFIDLKKEKLFRNGSIKDVTICTNINFDFDNLKREDVKVEHIDEQDDFLDFEMKDKQAERYKFNPNNIIPLLKPKIQNYNLTRLARRLVECYLTNSSIKHHDINDIFEPYQHALASEVININKKRFHDAFINGDDSLSENGKQFHQLFKKELNRQLRLINYNLDLKDVNEAIQSKTIIVDNKQVGLNLSKKFGRNPVGPIIWPDNPIPDDEIKDFCNHLIFAVNLPNIKKIDEILIREIGDKLDFDCITRENVYNKYFMKYLDWFIDKQREKFLTATDVRSFFEKLRKSLPISFDVTKPINSFTGRSNELKKLHSLLHGTTLQTASISGLGGIGKTELARMYINVHNKDYDEKFIWINATNYQTLSQSFKRLAADKLRIRTTNEEGHPRDIKSIVEDVYTFFSDGKCLFVFDNAEQLRSEDINDGGIKRFLSPLPGNVQPYVLITSRNQNWGDIKVVSLDVFTITEAIDFIKKSNIADNSRELVELLEYFPLALQQAVAYIKKKDTELRNIGSKFDINGYLQKFYSMTKELLNFQFPNDSSDLYTKTTYTTWKITIESIKDDPECGREAVEILEVMSHLNAKINNPMLFLPLVNNNEEKLASAIELLKQYSMIKSGISRFLSIHSLVRGVIRINLRAQKVELYIVQTLFILASIFFLENVRFVTNSQNKDVDYLFGRDMHRIMFYSDSFLELYFESFLSDSRKALSNRNHLTVHQFLISHLLLDDLDGTLICRYAEAMFYYIPLHFDLDGRSKSDTMSLAFESPIHTKGNAFEWPMSINTKSSIIKYGKKLLKGLFAEMEANRCRN